MNYQEIIAKMDDFNIGLSNGFGDVKTLVQFTNALRAVVEKHNLIGNEGWCELCAYEYPCPTISIIEKEING